MWVAKYWAEARLEHQVSARKQKNNRMVIRRLGWSNESQEAAQALADERAQQALNSVLSGVAQWDSIDHIEVRGEGYNGADGLPIREEVVELHGDSAITRNSYGALCLNTPDVMFIDVDEGLKPFNFSNWRLIRWVWLALAAGFLGLTFYEQVNGYGEAALACCQRSCPSLWESMLRALLPALGGGFALSMLALGLLTGLANFIYNQLKPPIKRIALLAASHPDWVFNVYRTTAGYRLLVLHQTFDPTDERIYQALEKLGADQRYLRMCKLQKCFRARLTPKPWRIGIGGRIPLGRRHWRHEYAGDSARLDWLREYEQAAAGYAVCHLVKRYGSSHQDFLFAPQIKAVLALHDKMCKVRKQKPLA